MHHGTGCSVRAYLVVPAQAFNPNRRRIVARAKCCTGLVVLIILVASGCPDPGEEGSTPSVESPSPSPSPYPTVFPAPTPSPPPAVTSTPLPPTPEMATPSPLTITATPTPAAPTPAGSATSTPFVEAPTGTPFATPTPTPTPQPTPLLDQDGDGFAAVEVGGEDCNDLDPSVNPAAQEVCDDPGGTGDPQETPAAGGDPDGPGQDVGGVDEDCDGLVDDADPSVDPDTQTTWFPDADLDGHGDDTGDGILACDDPSNPGQAWVDSDDDCDDENSFVYAGADEVCDPDRTDEDCDGLADDIDPDTLLVPADASWGTPMALFYPDGDGDGHGDENVPGAYYCHDPSGGGSLFSTGGDDCDDAEGTVYPGAAEVCDGLDNDCDGAVDDADSDVEGAPTWYADSDGDGYGDGNVSTGRCVQPDGYVGLAGDCDDTAAGVNPAATEWCNGVDDDCDGAIDVAAGSSVCFEPTNIDPGMFWAGEAELVFAEDTTIHTDTGEIEGLRGPGEGLVDGIYFEVSAQSDGSFLGLFAARRVEISTGATVLVVGPYPLVLVSGTDVLVAGSLSLVGGDGMDAYTTLGPTQAGGGVAGGADGGMGSDNHYAGATPGNGPGAGEVGVAGIHYGNGGGGAGHCWGGGGGMGDRPSVAGSPGTATGGGAGGFNYGDGGRGGNGGDPYGDLSLSPLQGGSGGAGGLSDTDYNPNGAAGGGGAGGGAVQVVAPGTIDVSGTIIASGGRGGDAYGGGGGGGSGGSVLLEASNIVVTGALRADGGRGGNGNLMWVPGGQTGGSAGAGTSPGGGGGGTESGGGGGAAGYVLVRYQDGVEVSGTISPDVSTDCAAVSPMQP